MDGIIIVDKPKGLTSHDVVGRVKRIYNAKKAGHTGTLDPIATGVLPVCLNRATKFSSGFLSSDKEYEVEMLLGVTTDTYDLDGKVLVRSEVPPDIEKRLGDVAKEFVGMIEQKPPYFSAIKYKGRPLYKWARMGKFIDLPPRRVEIKKFDIEKFEADTIFARVACSKGTYIRSLCHDLGARLGTGASMKALRRVTLGRFSIGQAVSLDSLEKCSSRDDLARYVLEFRV